MTSSPERPALPGRRRALVNVAANYGSFLVSAVVGFFLSPFVVHSLGNDAYGAWVLLGSLVGYLGLLDLGVRGAVTRYVANHHAAARHDEAGRLVSAALFLFGLSGLGAVMLTAGFATWGLHLFSLPPELEAVAARVVVIGGLNLAVSLVSGVFGGTVVGVHRFEVVNGVNVGVTLVRSGAIVVGLLAGGGLVTLAGIQLAASLVSGGALAFASRRVYPEMRIGLGRWRREHLRTLVSFGAFASLLQIASLVMYHTDTVMIGALLPVSAVTFFAIALNLIDYARRLVSGISQTMTPMVGALEGAERAERVGATLLTGARLATLVLLPVLVTFVVRGETFIGLWMGEEYARPSGLVLTVLALARWPAAGYQVCTSTLMGLNQHRGLVPAVIVEALANLGLSLALIGPFGITGVALGTLVPRWLISLAFGPWYVRRTIGLAPGRYYLDVLLRPGLALVPFALASLAFERWIPPDGLVAFFGQVALALPLAAAGAWPLALQAEERRRIVAAVRSALSRPAR
ncbi:MAG: polysaccharide biosynthesis C-terminal domain-containing protein [Myxococcota bacterium]